MSDHEDIENLEPDETSYEEEVDMAAVHAENDAVIEQFLRERDVPAVAEELPSDHRSGYVAVVGKPNVGKSTLLNALLGEKVAIVSPKPQTTRANQLGILTRPEIQIVFVDTPGIHEARTKLGEYMVDVARAAIPDADVVLFIVDLSGPPDAADTAIASLVRGVEVPVILALNKRDILSEDEADERIAAYRELAPHASAIEVSALTGTNVDTVLNQIFEVMPPGPRYFPADFLTQTQLRESAAELIREQVLLLYEQEVPHAVAVKVDEFKERSADLTYISATIFVERDSQKAILIGKRGAALKVLGKSARSALESMLETKVYLDLWVKVMKNWRKDEDALKRLGYDASA